jgi:acetyl esterase
MDALRSLANCNMSVEDLDCLRPDGSVMKIRLARPQGAGPFPAVIDIHGGGWVTGDRNQNALIDDALARQGIVVAAPEFRMPPHARYPVPIADVHLALRWLKHNAVQFGSHADFVGGIGTSSGGHQLLECILRPTHAQYASLSSVSIVADARVRFAVLCWPVADPLRRFHFARERSITTLLDAHAAFWPSEQAIAEGNPQLVIEQGKFEDLPALLVLQGTSDDNLPDDMASRFVSAYSQVGGRAELELFPGMPHAFVTRKPDAAESMRALSLIAEFIHARVPK